MSTPEEKLVQVEETLKNLENNLMKLNDEYDAKKAEIDGITNIKNSRLQVKIGGENIKEKKALSTKIFGIFGADTVKNTTRRLTDAKGKLQQRAYVLYMNKVDNIRDQYKRYTNLKEEIELEIQRKNEMQAKQDKLNKIENQKPDLIARYTKLGYTYDPGEPKWKGGCGPRPQGQNFGNCGNPYVQDGYYDKTDYFVFKTELYYDPKQAGWTEEKKIEIIPAVYGPSTHYGYGGYAEKGQIIKPEEKKEITVWKRPLPAGFPEKVEYNDFLTVIEKLESTSKNVQSRKRKQNRRKSMKARKN
jgi:hypothetical protein